MMFRVSVFILQTDQIRNKQRSVEISFAKPPQGGANYVSIWQKSQPELGTENHWKSIFFYGLLWSYIIFRFPFPEQGPNFTQNWDSWIKGTVEQVMNEVHLGFHVWILLKNQSQLWALIIVFTLFTLPNRFLWNVCVWTLEYLLGKWFLEVWGELLIKFTVWTVSASFENMSNSSIDLTHSNHNMLNFFYCIKFHFSLNVLRILQLNLIWINVLRSTIQCQTQKIWTGT